MTDSDNSGSDDEVQPPSEKYVVPDAPSLEYESTSVQSITPPPITTGTEADGKAQMWAAAIHASPILGLFVTGTGIPFLNIVAPLIIWLILKNQMPFVRSEGKEVLNYQISWTLYALIPSAIVFVIGVVLAIFVIGIFVIWALIAALVVYAIIMAVFSVIGAINASDGKPYRYPMTIRFIR